MRRAQIRQLLRQEKQSTAPAGFFVAQELSFLYGRLGDRDQALRWLQTSIDRREDAPLHMLTNPAYDSIRGDPRFRQLLETLKLRPYMKE